MKLSIVMEIGVFFYGLTLVLKGIKAWKKNEITILGQTTIGNKARRDIFYLFFLTGGGMILIVLFSILLRFF